MSVQWMFVSHDVFLGDSASVYHGMLPSRCGTPDLPQGRAKSGSLLHLCVFIQYHQIQAVYDICTDQELLGMPTSPPP